MDGWNVQRNAAGGRHLAMINRRQCVLLGEFLMENVERRKHIVPNDPREFPDPSPSVIELRPRLAISSAVMRIFISDFSAISTFSMGTFH